jgi:hypothetical protein
MKLLEHVQTPSPYKSACWSVNLEILFVAIEVQKDKEF